MARKRMIDPNIWESEDFSCLNNLEKLVFIGMFSLSDDEGYGKSNPTFIKNSLFPYSDDVRTADIEKSLCSIAAHMSVVFYQTDNGKQYYYLKNWDKWQTIQKPKTSTIPKPSESVQYLYNTDTVQVQYEYNTSTVRVQPKGKEKEKKGIEKEREGEISPPALDEIKKFCIENNIQIDCEKFFDHYESVGWKINGNAIVNWRSRVKSWAKEDEERKRDKSYTGKSALKPPNGIFNNYSQKVYTDEEIEEILKMKRE